MGLAGADAWRATFRAASLQGQSKSVGQLGLGHDIFKVDAQVDDGLRDLRPHTADDAFRAHQPSRGDGLQQVLRNQRVHGRHARDVDDGELRIRCHNCLQQALHHYLGARAVESADDGKRQDAVPKLDHRRRQLKEFLLLPRDKLLPRGDEGIGCQKRQPVQQLGCRPYHVEKLVLVAIKAPPDGREKRLLDRQNKRCHV